MPTADRVYLLTPPGSAAIAVLRLVGRGVDPFLRSHFSKPAVLGRCVHGVLGDGDQIIDDPVIVRVDDHTVDINLHGGPWVVRSAIQLAVAAGFVEVKQGTAHSNVTDGNSPVWQEVLAALPQAITEQATRVMLSQPAAWDALASRVSDLVVSSDELNRILSDRSAHWLLNMPTVAIIGPPNVGKSTLANQLFAQERSITADLPGTTRDWVGEIANLDGLAVMLVDTPGLRVTADPIEHAAIVASRQKVRAVDLVVVVLDRSRPISADEQSLLLEHLNAIVVAHKADATAAWGSETVNAIDTVATTGRGVDAVRAAIRRRFDCESFDLDRPRCWTARQRDLLVQFWQGV